MRSLRENWKEWSYKLFGLPEFRHRMLEGKEPLAFHGALSTDAPNPVGMCSFASLPQYLAMALHGCCS